MRLKIVPEHFERRVGAETAQARSGARKEEIVSNPADFGMQRLMFTTDL